MTDTAYGERPEREDNQRQPPKSIELHDIKKIITALTEQVGPNHWHEEWGNKTYHDRYRTKEGWDVLIGGWRHREGWSRGYMIFDRLYVGKVDVQPRGHISPRHRGGRYGGRGWRDRMVEDIVRDIEVLRIEASVGVRT